MHRILAGLPAVVALTACAPTSPDEPPIDLIAVPTQEREGFLGVGEGCPAALLEGTLIRDEEFGFAVAFDDPLIPPSVVVWPHGWGAADVDGVRQLLDGGRAVVAREGDRVWAGGGFGPPDDRFTPCGEIRFTPAP